MTDDFRQEIRSVLDKAVLPHADQWEQQGHVSADGWRALADAGLLSLPHNGPGFLRSAVFLDELGGTGYAGIRASIGVSAYMAPAYLHLYGTESQRATWLTPGKIAALAITEQNAGTDLSRLSTVAKPDGGTYRLTGEKLYVANGSAADYFIVLARTRDGGTAPVLSGASLLVVDGRSPGITRHRHETLGWRAADACRVSFDDVPAAGVIGKPDRALMYLMPALDFERLVAGLLAVGGVRHCLDLLRSFVRSHQVRGAALSANQAVRHRLADLDAQFELVRTYGYQLANEHCAGRLDTKAAAVLKLTATELAVTAAQVCVQYHGARGYLDDSVPARLHRDAMAGTIAAGASELVRELIFESGR
ncbi:acyl-CoA dehydrogenase family protein [Lentzea sp. NPDC092896]|uniref:acyl-CoA dehydrogenase family protein n=1 Tax=Lentzea sp. NPDC092896 TaxID=3364127 RepID=UPI00382B90F9